MQCIGKITPLPRRERGDTFTDKSNQSSAVWDRLPELTKIGINCLDRPKIHPGNEILGPRELRH